MQFRKTRALTYIFRVSGLAALVILATTAPARAGDPNYEGFYYNLDLALTQPNSLDQNFASHIDLSATPIETERLVMDNEDDFTFRVSIGYSWGSLGSLQVSYWTFDNDDRVSGNELGDLNPSIVGFSAYYGQYLRDDVTGVDFEARSSVEATTWDLDYVRPMTTGGKLTVKWLAGLRVAQYEEDQRFEGTETYNGDTYIQAKHFESDGIGFRVGATAVFDFTKHFGIETSLAVSFLQADTEGRALVSDNSGSFSGGEIIEASDDNIRGEIREYGVRAVWSAGPVDWFVGYSAAAWDGLVTDPITTGVAVPISVNQRARDGIGFNSVNAGVTWRFNPGR